MDALNRGIDDLVGGGVIRGRVPEDMSLSVEYVLVLRVMLWNLGVILWG